MNTFLGAVFLIIGIVSVLFGIWMLTGNSILPCTPPPIGSIWEMERGTDPFVVPLKVRVEEVKEGYVKYVFWDEEEARWLDKHTKSGVSDTCKSFLQKHKRVDQ